MAEAKGYKDPITGVLYDFTDSDAVHDVRIGTVSELAEGSKPTVTATRSGDIVTLNFGFPKTSSGGTTTTTYTITNNLTNCTNSNSAKTMTAGSIYTATIKANNGYTLNSISCTMGGTAQTISDGSINISNVTGNIVITASASVLSSDTYTVTNTLTNCTNSNSVTIVPAGSAYTATISPNSGYALGNVTCIMGTDPQSTSGYKVDISSVTGNIVIKARAVSTAVPDNTISLASYSSLASSNTNWSPAITQAETDCLSQGKNLFIPNGTYIVRDYLTKKSGVNWIGENREKVELVVEDTFNYSSSNKGRYVMQNENMWNTGATSTYDTFELRNITFRSRLTCAKWGTLTKDDYMSSVNTPEGWCRFVSTKDLIVDNCKIVNYKDADTPIVCFRGMDFYGANVNSEVSNCYCYYDSCNTRWGSFTFRNFSTVATTDINIHDNQLIRRVGTDEVGWICANKGWMNRITVKDNMYDCDNDTTYAISGIIDIQQGDATVSVDDASSRGVSDVTVEGNIINAYFMHSVIRVGSYSMTNGSYTFPAINKAVIKNNTINCRRQISADGSYGIVTDNVTSAEISGNTIKGTCKRFISGGTKVFNNTIIEDTIGSDATDLGTYAPVGIESWGEVYGNTVNVSLIGLRSCTNAHDNNITCNYNIATKKEVHTFKNNVFTKKWPGSPASNYTKSYFIMANSATGSLTYPQVNITGGTLSGFDSSKYSSTDSAYKCDVSVGSDVTIK